MKNPSTCAIFSSKTLLVKFFRHPIRGLSDPPIPSTADNSSVKCPTDDPSQHNCSHLGQIYSIKLKELTKTIPSGIHKYYLDFSATFRQCPLMVRSPALQVIENLRAMPSSVTPLRFLYYGETGAGKSMSIAHVLHYCLLNDWVVVHVDRPLSWMYSSQSLSSLDCDPESIVQPLEASAWLKHFKTQNEDIIRKLDIRTRKTHVWSRREESQKGSSLLEVVDQGIVRPLHACDVVGVILEELRDQAGRNLKLMVVVDGVNSFWDDRDHRFGRRKLWKRDPDKLVLVRHFKNLVCSPPKLGIASLFSVDPITPRGKTNYLPKYLLTDKGFLQLDPFLPIKVPLYSPAELTNHWTYLIDLKWITNPAYRTQLGLEELIFTSARNPYHFFLNTCSI